MGEKSGALQPFQSRAKSTRNATPVKDKMIVVTKSEQDFGSRAIRETSTSGTLNRPRNTGSLSPLVGLQST